MEKYYLAIDIGASSGRRILSHMENGKMMLEEIHRFPNGMEESQGQKVWNVDVLFQEIKDGMKKCAELGNVDFLVQSIAIVRGQMEENSVVAGNLKEEAAAFINV